MDKVQKIKEWISKTQDGLMDDNGNFEYKEHEGAYNILCNLDAYIDSLQEEPVSGSINFEQELYKAFGQVKDFTLGMRIAKRFYDMGSKSGAKWQFDQLEKNRLAHCDAQKEEEAEIERDFVMSIVENEHRQPTFDDAIKYGMKLRKEQMVANAIDGRLYSTICGSEQNVVAYVGYGEYGKDGDKVKVIIINGD